MSKDKGCARCGKSQADVGPVIYYYSSLAGGEWKVCAACREFLRLYAAAVRQRQLPAFLAQQKVSND